jgi:hypothetical protein
MRRSVHREALMPRFVGKRPYGLWLDVVAVVILVIVIVIVLQVTGTIHIFGSVPMTVPA